MHGKQVSYVTLVPRAKRETFWQRNQDKIVVAIVSILLGAVGTLVVEWLKRYFFPK